VSIPEQIFSRDEARAAAEEVINYDPSVGRNFSFVPKDRAAADAAVAELSAQWQGLAPTWKSAIEGAASNASLLSEDPLQGIAELIQNADDVAARSATLALDQSSSTLVFEHDGSGLTLHDVWGLAIPWLSMKSSDPDAVGRFGIGLKTLRSLSTTLVVHQGHFSVEIDDRDLRAVPPAAEGATGEDRALTTFAIPFAKGAVTPRQLSAWVSAWGDAGLVFLRSLETVRLSGIGGTVLHVEREPAEVIASKRGNVSRSRVHGRDDRTWSTYSRAVTVSAGGTRARKATAPSAMISLAFPEFAGDTGFLHVGLPVREVGLPFRISAPFDPLANRREISSAVWNADLITRLADLWTDAAVDRFDVEPSVGWGSVPLASETEQIPLVPFLQERLEREWLVRARLEFTQRVRLPWKRKPRALVDFAYECEELDGLLAPDDVRRLADSVGAITQELRSTDDRWRRVLRELAELDTMVPTVVEVADAVDLLNETNRSPAFLADLLAVCLVSGHASAVAYRKCITLKDGTRVMPSTLTGLRVLSTRKAGALWSTLSIGAQLHPTYSRRPGWGVVKEWLRDSGHLVSDGSDEAALRALSRGGRSGHSLPDPLSDAQVEALRSALEKVGSVRDKLGPGIGLAIQVNGQEYDAEGRRLPVPVRPAKSYFIEGSATSFNAAAGRTRGLSWIERRYTDVLKAEEGFGAQRFFIVLGAERAPRLTPHRELRQRFQGKPLGVPRSASGSPTERSRTMSELRATYTLEDVESPDMEAVLESIAAEPDESQRIRRTIAMLATLNRALERYKLDVEAVIDDRAWGFRGQIRAWWLYVAMSTPWLTADNGIVYPPTALNLRTSVNVRSLGDDSALFLHRDIDPQPIRTVLEALGVRGDPGLDELLTRLKAVASESATSPHAAADQAAPYYVSLASQIELGEFADGKVRLRAEFNAGSGLVASDRGWRRASVVYSGAPVFGSYLDFVPSVPNTEALWEFLGVPRPGVTQAVDVLKVLAQSKATELEQSDEQVMLEALRLMAASPGGLPKLNKSALWVGNRWTTERPVFAIANPLVASELLDRVAVWSPGGSIAPLDSLIAPYAMSRLDELSGRVVAAAEAVPNDPVTATFRTAMQNLRSDLALSDPSTEQSITVPWDEFENWSVQTLPGLEVELPNPAGGAKITISVPAWADASALTLYVADPNDVGHERGAQAVASLFMADSRRTSHDWLAAWAKARDGMNAERVETAAARDSRLKRQRAAAAELAASKVKLTTIADRKKKRPASPVKGNGPAVLPAIDTPTPPRSRLLIDIEQYVIVNEKGEMVGKGAPPPVPRVRRGAPGLKTPDRTNPKRPALSVSRPMNFTPEERETLGARIAQWVLGLSEEELIDIRNQSGVGADAIDTDNNYYEFKVHSGEIPDQVRLEPTEFQRALVEKEKYFLVIVGNVEEGRGDPVVRVIADPLSSLTLERSQLVKLTGVLSASEALGFGLAPRAD
jgi:hypothetical protein